MTAIETIESLIRDHREELWLLGVASVVMLVGSVVAIPVLIARLPADYFVGDAPPANRPHPALHVVLVVSRNVLGLVLLAAGIAMLFLPGQGLLTIAMALVLLDFPGKRTVERRLIARPALLRAANRIRSWRGHPPLLAPRDAESDPPAGGD